MGRYSFVQQLRGHIWAEYRDGPLVISRKVSHKNFEVSWKNKFRLSRKVRWKTFKWVEFQNLKSHPGLISPSWLSSFVAVIVKVEPLVSSIGWVQSRKWNWHSFGFFDEGGWGEETWLKWHLRLFNGAVLIATVMQMMVFVQSNTNLELRKSAEMG